MAAHNTFDNPNKVYSTEFTEAAITDTGISFTIPAHSVLALEVCLA